MSYDPSSIEALDQRGVEIVEENVHFRTWKDRRNLGLLYTELLKAGQGVSDPMRPVLTDVDAQKFADFSTWSDLPVGTRLPADIGGDWRWNGTAWVPARRFLLQPLVQGSLAVPVATVNNPGVGFSGFGPAIAMPLGFWTPGRRLRLTGNVVHPSGNSTTAHTQLTIGGVVVLDSQWTGSAIGQYFDIDLWVSGPTQITVSARVTYVVASPPESIVDTAADIAVAGLDTTAKSISLGIFESAGAAGLYKLIDFPIEVLA